MPCSDLREFIKYKIHKREATLQGFHRFMVIGLKNRCEENVKFVNKCCDEFYRLQMTPLKDTSDLEEKIKLLKIKMDCQHQIKIQRFIKKKDQIRKSDKFLKIKDNLELRHLKVISNYPNINRIHPTYKKFWLERMEDSYLFDNLLLEDSKGITCIS